MDEKDCTQHNAQHYRHLGRWVPLSVLSHLPTNLTFFYLSLVSFFSPWAVQHRLFSLTSEILHVSNSFPSNSGCVPAQVSPSCSHSDDLLHLLCICPGAPLSGLQTAASTVLSCGRDSRPSVSQTLRALIPPWGPILMTSTNPNHLPIVSHHQIPSLEH